MPGVIIQALSTLQVNNPVILLDEIDKLTRNAMFNPAGAMLELLDPEQNHTFKDHYLNTPFDMSKVLFLCTCNDLGTIDRPLLDRMEVIELSGYTVEEKVHIATTHLLPKQRKLHALEPDDPKESTSAGSTGEDSTDAVLEPAPEPPPKTLDQPRLVLTQDAIAELITKWTMESGVRSLERHIAKICRWAAFRLAGSESSADSGPVVMPAVSDRDVLAEQALGECGPNDAGQISVEARHLPHIMGAEIFEPDLAERLTVGVAMGLGVTPVGGQLLFVEATRSKGSRRLTVTGQLGDVMKESVSTAMSLLRSKLYYAALETSGELAPASSSDAAVKNAGADPAVLQQLLLAQGDAAKDPFGNDDIHVHFPAGGIPKDGPSAGVTTTLALASLLLGRPVRSDTAVTGEITLRGHILPVGGIRDKVLAAHRAGVSHVLLPFANQAQARDDLQDSSLGDVQLHFVKHIDEALEWAFADRTLPNAPPEDEATHGAADSAAASIGAIGMIELLARL
jgi:ATP-dependent Lon protease